MAKVMFITLDECSRIIDYEPRYRQQIDFLIAPPAADILRDRHDELPSPERIMMSRRRYRLDGSVGRIMVYKEEFTAGICSVCLDKR